MAKFFKSIGDFFSRIGSDISKVYVRAAFVDVKDRADNLTGKPENQLDNEKEVKIESEGFFSRIGSNLTRITSRAAFIDVEKRLEELFDTHGAQFDMSPREAGKEHLMD